METGSLTVANALRHNIAHQLDAGDVLDSYHDILRVRSDLSVKHIRRQANRLAHTLAKLPYLSRIVNVFHSPLFSVLEMLYRLTGWAGTCVTYVF